jgi:hypothetical protein
MTIASEQASTTDGWIEQVRSGDFGAIPQPFTWNQSVELAHLINGYAAAEEIGLGELGLFANMRGSLQAATGQWDGTATELWFCLFFAHRSARHSGGAEEYGNGSTKLNALCAALRNKLQSITPTEHRLLSEWLGEGF